MQRWGALLAAALVCLGLTACSEADGDVSGWCANVEELARFLEDPPDTSDFETFDELEDALAELERLEASVRDEAPDSVSDEVDTIFTTDPDTLRVSEQDAVDDARDKVNSYIREECDLSVTL